jgi:hypothetical protein
MLAFRVLVAVGAIIYQCSAEFSCGSAVTTASGNRGHQVVLTDCEANLALFNADPVWSLWAASTELLFACGSNFDLVSSGCPDAANHLNFINTGGSVSPGFGCTTEGALATTECVSDLLLINAYIAVATTAVPETTAASAPDITTVPETQEPETSQPVVEVNEDSTARTTATTTTDGPAFDNVINTVTGDAKPGKGGEVGHLHPTNDGGSGSGSGSSFGGKSKGKKEHRKEKGKKVSQSGFQVKSATGAIAIVSGVAAGLVVAIATVLRAKKLAAENKFVVPTSSSSFVEGTEVESSTPLLRQLTTWTRHYEGDDEYATPQQLIIEREAVRTHISLLPML